MLSNSDSRWWALTPELQKKFDEVQAETRRLQAEFGITPMTLEERAAAYTKRKEEEAKAKQMLAQRRPPSRWKV